MSPREDPVPSTADGPMLPGRNMMSWNKGTTPTRCPGILKTATGYRVRVRAVDSRTGKLKEANRHYAGIDLATALERQSAMRRELEANAPKRERLRVGEFARSWIGIKAGVVAENTLEGYAFALDCHILPEVGDMFYEAVGQLEVQGMVNAWRKKKRAFGGQYSDTSIADWFRIFRNMTRDAMAQLGLKLDPTLRVSLGDERTPKKQPAATPGEVLAVIEAMKRKRPGSYALLHTLATTGQRFCHVSALRWADVDFDRGVIRFNKKQVNGKEGRVSQNKQTTPLAPMMAELAIALLQHKARLARLDYGTEETDLVFPSRTGGHRRPSGLNKAVERSAAEAGVTGRVTPHRMRYLFTDLLRQAGIDQVTRKAMVGHVTDEMQEHYSTVDLGERREAMALVEAKLQELRASGDRGGDRLLN